MKYKSSNRWPQRILEPFFDNWSENMAYVLGYFAADGGMYKNRRGSCYVAFTSTDKELITLIKELMYASNIIESYKNPKKTWKRRYVLQLGSRKLYERLLQLGFTPRKSLSLIFPNIPDNILNHFLRGYFDGDGCAVFAYYKRKQRKNLQKILNIRIRCGSKKFLQTLQDKLSAVIRIGKGGLYFHGGAYELVYSTKDVIELYSFMYPIINVPCFRKKKRHTNKGT